MTLPKIATPNELNCNRASVLIKEIMINSHGANYLEIVR